ncbi:MAG: AMP-binding protein, partial [Gemmatimonadetes bacterium]|nr:AMP-binding protein [Gemmatimonadota bacterium]NIV23774.1 AMP-binding protein [Gemmatimonadota bacterium]NIW75658.1 AMP-binding protein [Gemmatimonadota bacterium]
VRELVETGSWPASVSTVNLAGEAFLRPLAEAVHRLPGVRRVHNLYGPTEDTTYSTWEPVAAGESAPPAIGRPVTGGRALVLDRAFGPVPRGVVADLYLSGAGLAVGYLGRPSRTAASFLPDPWNPRPG